jgi:hypothetical protein
MNKDTEAKLKLGTIEQTRINRLWFDMLGKDAGTELVDILKNKFAKHSLVKRLPDGSVDTTATLIQLGAYEAVSYITQSIELGEQGK